MLKKSSCVIALCLFGFALSSQSVKAEPPKPANFPNRPINFVVSYPAGGGMDITARTLAAQMERVTGYQFRVQNRGGGGGIIGNTFVAKQAKPDGYTVGILANPTLIINILGQGAHFARTRHRADCGHHVRTGDLGRSDRIRNSATWISSRSSPMRRNILARSK